MNSREMQIENLKAMELENKKWDYNSISPVCNAIQENM